jgi:hypothetical protein
VPQFPTKALLALAVLGGIVLPGLYDLSQVREEKRLYDAGRYEEAAKVAGRIHLLRFYIRPRLVAQVSEMGDLATSTRGMPFFAEVARLTEDPVMLRRLASALVSPDPTRLSVRKVTVTPGAPPAAAASPVPELFRAAPKADVLPDEEGGAVKLERKDGNAWEPLGDGFAGTLGSSFDASQDGKVLWMARSEQQLVRVDLESGKQQIVPVAGAPGLVALAPNDADKLAFSLEGPQGDVAYVWDHGVTRRLFPPEGQKPAPGLTFEWADDGKSLAVRWEEQAPDGTPNTQLVWLRPDGTVGLEATLEAGLADSNPSWVPAPGGERMGLAAGGGTWMWAEAKPKAVELPGLGEIWGFDPIGHDVASLDGSKLVILAVLKPAQRVELAVPDLPKAFEADPGSFRWARNEFGDRISVSGGVPDLQGKPTTITVDLQLRR